MGLKYTLKELPPKSKAPDKLEEFGILSFSFHFSLSRSWWQKEVEGGKGLSLFFLETFKWLELGKYPVKFIIISFWFYFLNGNWAHLGC